jgi:hypothetical protein
MPLLDQNHGIQLFVDNNFMRLLDFKIWNTIIY